MKILFLLCDFIAAALVIAACNWLALIPFRRSAGNHWADRARNLYPARVGALSGIWLVPVDLVLAQDLIWPEQSPHWLIAGFAGWSGAILGTYFLDREVFPWLAPRDWLREATANWALRFAWLFLFFGIMAVMPREVSWRTAVLTAILVVAFVFWLRGGLVWSCKKLGLLEPTPENLSQIVAAVSARMNVSVRGVWMLRSSAAQALALPYTGDLLFTTRLLDTCAENQIAAICAHELSHLSESKLARAGRLLSGFVYLPWAFVRPLRHAVGDWAFLILFATSWVLLIFTRKHSRRLETRADNMAREQEADPGVYARALSTLYEANLMPAVMPKKNSKTHPDLYDRLLAVGVQPDYPRPEPASPFSVALLYSMILGVMLVPALGMHFERNEHDARPEAPSGVSQEDSKPKDTPANDTRAQ